MQEMQGWRRVEFKKPHKLPIHVNGKVQNNFCTGQEYMSREDVNVLGSPTSAMEYLSRSWSPAAFSFLQIFSSSNLLVSLEDSCFLGKHRDMLNHRGEECEEESETEDKNQRLFLCHQFDSGDLEGEPETKEKNQRKPPKEKEVVNRMDSLQALFAIDRPHITAYQRNASIDLGWPKYKHVKGWFRGKPIKSFLKWQKAIRKEELRLQTAKIDAALSVARLAAAIAGITGTSIIGLENLQTNGTAVPCDNSTGNVMSLAAALVAAVCAEAAETAGAPREHVASVINSGFATQTPEDIVTLTATAATCLRGAATLRSRTIADTYFQEAKELLASCTPLPVITASGHRRHRSASIHIKCRQLLLRLAKKYFGALISCKEYKILDMMEEACKSRGYYLISLQTDGGDIKLLFQNEEQSEIWMSTISNFLGKRNVERSN